MGIAEVRAALQKLHQEKATLVRSKPVEWPEDLVEKDLPAILVKRGDATWSNQGSVRSQVRMWHPQIFLCVKSQKRDMLPYAENLAIAITQQLGEIYTDPANQNLNLGGEPCRFAKIIQNEQARDTGIQDTEIGVLVYRAVEYYGFEFQLPIIEKHQ